MFGGNRAVRTALAITTAVAISSGHGLAQQAGTTGQAAVATTPNNARTGSIDLTTSVSIDTNPTLAQTSPGTQIDVSERLGFRLKTETRNQVFEVFGAGSVQLTFGNGSSQTSFTSPDLNLRYTRDAANAGLVASYRYVESDVTTTFDANPSATVTNLVVDSGTVARQGANVTLDLGRQAPFSPSLSVSHDIVDYSGTADPSLFDETTTTYTGRAGLRFSGVTQGTLTLDYTDYSAQDAARTNTETTNVDFALKHELRRALVIDANLGAQHRELRSRGGNTNRSGLRAGLRLTQTLPAGSIYAGAKFDDTGPSDTASLTFGRTFTLPTGNLSAEVTALNVGGNGVRLIGNAGYSQQLASGSLGVSVNQSLSVNNLDQEILSTQLSLGYQQQVNATSDISVSLDVARTEDGGAGSVPTQNRGTFVAQLNRQLTPEWAMSVGLQHRFYDTDTTSPATGNSVFLTLTRNIQFGF